MIAALFHDRCYFDQYIGENTCLFSDIYSSRILSHAEINILLYKRYQSLQYIILKSIIKFLIFNDAQFLDGKYLSHLLQRLLIRIMLLMLYRDFKGLLPLRRRAILIDLRLAARMSNKALVYFSSHLKSTHDMPTYISKNMHLYTAYAIFLSLMSAVTELFVLSHIIYMFFVNIIYSTFS